MVVFDSDQIRGGDRSLLYEEEAQKSYISHVDRSVVRIYPLLGGHIVERSWRREASLQDQQRALLRVHHLRGGSLHKMNNYCSHSQLILGFFDSKYHKKKNNSEVCSPPV